jgi:hypothetical protein
MVNFRVTQDEYRQLREASVARGARGLSDYARWATLNSIRQTSSSEQLKAPPDGVATWLDERFAALESSIRRLLDVLNKFTQGEAARIEESGTLPGPKR